MNILHRGIFERRFMKKEQECCCRKVTHREEAEKRKLHNRLKRIEGQVRGLEKMVEQDVYCNEILMQSAAVNAAIRAFERELLSNHMHHCVAKELREGNDAIMDELMNTIHKLMK